METLGTLAAGASLCAGSMAFVLILLYARRTGSRGWLLTSLMIAVLALQSVNLRFSAFPGAGAEGTMSGIDFRNESLFVDFLVRQILGSLINLSMLGLFPFLLFSFGLIGRRAKKAMVAVFLCFFAYQAAFLFIIFRHIRATGRLGELPMAGNILFIAYLLSCFLTLFLKRRRSTPMFREFLKGSLPLLFTIFPFLAADLLSIEKKGAFGSFLVIGMILYFCFFFVYALFHFFSILQMGREEGEAAQRAVGESGTHEMPAIEAARRNFALSERECEVLKAMLEGKTNPQIADSLCVSLATVKTHTNHIFQKTGARNRLELFAKLN